MLSSSLLQGQDLSLWRDGPRLSSWGHDEPGNRLDEAAFIPSSSDHDDRVERIGILEEGEEIGDESDARVVTSSNPKQLGDADAWEFLP